MNPKDDGSGMEDCNCIYMPYGDARCPPSSPYLLSLCLPPGFRRTTQKGSRVPSLSHSYPPLLSLDFVAPQKGASFSGFRKDVWAVPGGGNLTFRGIKNLDATIEW
jgi:hypothetical protein